MSEKLEPPDLTPEDRSRRLNTERGWRQAFWLDYQAVLVDEAAATGMTDAEVCERLLIAEMLKRES